jgi:hypothetical protein
VAQQQPNNPNNGGQNILPASLVQDIVKTEQQKIAFKVEELKIKDKEIDSNERLAKFSMEREFQLLEKKPDQHRQITIVYTCCISALLIIFLGFIGFLVISGQSAFVEKFLGWIAYLVISGLSFWAGRYTKTISNKKDKQQDDISDATII